MRKTFWSNSMTYEWFRNEATDKEILIYFEDNDLDLDDFVEYDDEGEVIEDSYDYDAMRNWLCDSEYVIWNDQDWEDLQYNILPEIEKQIQRDFLIIDEERVNPGAWSRNAGREKYHYWFDPIVEKIQDYYGNAEIDVNEYEEIIGWYTLPKEDSKIYNMARHSDSVKDAVKEELRARLENEADCWDYDSDGRDLWIEVFWNIIDDDDMDWSDIEKYLVPIRNPFMIE